MASANHGSLVASKFLNNLNRRLEREMIPLIRIFIVLAIIIFGPTDLMAFWNEPKGYKEYEWGTSRKNISGLKHTPEYEDLNGRLKCYYPISDKLEHDGIPLIKIEYIFYDDKLVWAIEEFDCQKYIGKFYSKLEIELGRPTKSEGHTKYEKYRGKRTANIYIGFNTTITFDTSKHLNRCVIEYKSRDFEDHVQNWSAFH